MGVVTVQHKLRALAGLLSGAGLPEPSNTCDLAADAIDDQAARIAELEESLDAMARGEAWLIDPHAYKNVMTGEYASAVKRATPNFPFDGGARFLDRDGYKEHCWLSECYPTHEAAEAARKVIKDE